MKPISTEQLLAALNWRYATKQFDPARKIPDDLWSTVEASLVLSPSSYGLQPWRFVVVTNQALKEELVGASYGQRQVADCSHLVVMAARVRMTEEDVDRLMGMVESTQGRARETMSGYRDLMVGDIVHGPRSENATEWAKMQCYIALGGLMTAAALLGLDACPMEGFAPPAYDEALGFEAEGLTTAVLCPMGYRLTDDKYAALPKVRYPMDEMIRRVE